MNTRDVKNTDLYAGKVDHYFSSQRREMIPFVPETAKCLLEIGCGTGSFGAYLKSLRPIEITGIELQRSAAESAVSVIDRVIELDVDAGILELKGEQFDCIVFNDVLEHLVDPWQVLKKIRALIAPGGTIVASIPNVRYMPVLKDFLIAGNWQYQRDGVMDKTHLRFFTKKSIASLFNSCGFEILTLEGINGLVFPWKYSLLNSLSGGRLEDTRYQQFACVATLHNDLRMA